MATDSQQVVSPEGLEGGQSVPLPSDNGPEWTPEVGQPAIADLQRIPVVAEVGQHATADPQNEIQVSQHAAEPVPSTSTGGATPSGLNFTELTRVINDQSGRMELLTGQIASITNALGQLQQRAQSVPPPPSQPSVDSVTELLQRVAQLEGQQATSSTGAAAHTSTHQVRQPSSSEGGAVGGAPLLSSASQAVREGVPPFSSQQATAPHAAAAQPRGAAAAVSSGDITDAVNRRLAELGLEDDLDTDDTEGPNFRRRVRRSGMARTVEDQVLVEIDWPHFHLYRGNDRRPARFNELTPIEFSYGFMMMLNNHQSRFDRVVMTDLFTDILTDALSFPWEQVRNFYRVVASGVEMKRWTWTDTAQIQRLRFQYAQRPYLPSTFNRQNRTGGVPCDQFQRGACTEHNDHANFRHICAYCFRTLNLNFRHSENDCRRKKQNEPKNSREGEQ